MQLPQLIAMLSAISLVACNDAQPAVPADTPISVHQPSEAPASAEASLRPPLQDESGLRLSAMQPEDKAPQNN